MKHENNEKFLFLERFQVRLMQHSNVDPVTEVLICLKAIISKTLIMLKEKK